MRFLIAVLLVGLIGACSGKPNLDDPVLSGRELRLEEFFDGKSTAYGQFQNVFGTVQRRFVVDIKGSFDGSKLTLVENFVYDDDTTERRIWTLEKTGDQTWSGTAPGVIGTASGKEHGDTFNWSYKIDLPVKQGTMRVEFDDWMWLLTDDRLLNRAYVSRFGVRIGEVIIYFEKS